MMDENWMGLVEAAFARGITRERMLRKVLTRQVVAQHVAGRWYVLRESLKNLDGANALSVPAA